MPEAIPWDRFSADPRVSDNAHLRASDADRNVALDVLSAGYADGRVTREEYDERSTSVQGAKTLGELVTPIRDLAPSSASLTPSNPDQLQAKAEDRYLQKRSQALASFLGPSLICWIIWVFQLLNAHGGFPFPWPIFVSLGSITWTARVLSNKRRIIAEEKRNIEREELRAIDRKPC